MTKKVWRSASNWFPLMGRLNDLVSSPHWPRPGCWDTVEATSQIFAAISVRMCMQVMAWYCRGYQSISDSNFLMKHATRSSLNLKLLVSTDPPQSIDYIWRIKEAWSTMGIDYRLQGVHNLDLISGSSSDHSGINFDGLISLRGPYGEYSDVLPWNSRY